MDTQSGAGSEATKETIASLASHAIGCQRGADARYLIGITGPPGAGKSTLMQALVAAVSRQIGREAVAGVPMDGFHMTNARLASLGRTQRKGAPDTFEASEFVDALLRLRSVTDKATLWPTYSRNLHEPVKEGMTIHPAARLIFVEGNYLLFDDPPWKQVGALLDEVWYVDADRPTLRQRLLNRQLRGGRPLAAAAAHVDHSDSVNIDTVEQTRGPADRVVRVDSGDPLLRELTDPATGAPLVLD